MLAATAVIGAAPVYAQTITVAKTGSPTYNTLQAALDHFETDPDPNTPNVVQITDSAVYDEVLTVKSPLTLEGTGSARPVLTVRENATGFDNDGTTVTHVTEWAGGSGLLIDIPITMTTASVALKNLVIIPSKTGTPPINGLSSKANNFFLHMENLLVTGNDGNDAPISTDGLTAVPPDGNHVHFLVSGGHIGSITNNRPEADGAEVLMRNCIFTHNKGTLGGSWRSGFFMCRIYYVTGIPPGAGTPTRPTAYRRLVIDDGCKFTFNNGSGLRTAASTTIETPDNRTFFAHNSEGGLWLDTQRGVNEINGIISANNGTTGVNEGLGNILGGVVTRMNLRNAIIANNGWYGSYNRQGVAAMGITIMENVTIANNDLIHGSTNPILSSPANNTVSFNVKNCIIAGNGQTTKQTNSIRLQCNVGTFTHDYTALVTNGPHAMYQPPIWLEGTSAAAVGTPVSDADPEFLNTAPEDFASPQFYAVNASAYASLAEGGLALSGGGVYVPAASVSDWSVY